MRTPHHLLLSLTTLALGACASGGGAAGPVWWGVVDETEGSEAHVITGGVRTGRFMAEPKIQVRFPADWRSAPREAGEDGTLVAQFVGVVVTPLAGEQAYGYASKSRIYVQTERRLGGRRPHGMRQVAAAGEDIYLVREEFGEGGEVSGVKVIGFDGWPRVPVEVASFRWMDAPSTTDGWEASFWHRGPLQVGVVVGVLAAAWLAFDLGLDRAYGTESE